MFRTVDHSMVFEMVKQGVITEEQARLSSQSNVITRALGIKPDLEVEVHEVPYIKGDRFALCSDGIHGELSEKELVKLFGNRKRTLGSTVDDIATLVDNTGRSNGGGHDNLTLAMVEMNTNSKLKTKMTKQAKLTMVLLAVVCAVSIAFNISQAVGKSSPDTACLQDSVEAKDKKIHELDSINKAQLNKLKSVDSIMKKK